MQATRVLFALVALGFVAVALAQSESSFLLLILFQLSFFFLIVCLQRISQLFEGERVSDQRFDRYNWMLARDFAGSSEQNMVRPVVLHTFHLPRTHPHLHIPGNTPHRTSQELELITHQGGGGDVGDGTVQHLEHLSERQGP